MNLSFEVTWILSVIITATLGIWRISQNSLKRHIATNNELKEHKERLDFIDKRYDKTRAEISNKVADIGDTITAGFLKFEKRMELHEQSNSNTDILFKSFQTDVTRLQESTKRLDKLEELTIENAKHIAVVLEGQKNLNKYVDRLLSVKND